MREGDRVTVVHDGGTTKTVAFVRDETNRKGDVEIWLRFSLDEPLPFSLRTGRASGARRHSLALWKIEAGDLEILREQYGGRL